MDITAKVGFLLLRIALPAKLQFMAVETHDTKTKQNTRPKFKWIVFELISLSVPLSLQQTL